MLNEFTKNPDGLRLSTYFFKDRNKRIEYGPVWDFDRTMGCDDDGRAANPVGWSGSYRHGWWSRVMSNKAFKELYAQRWGEVRGSVMSRKKHLLNHRRMGGTAGRVGPAQLHQVAPGKLKDRFPDRNQTAKDMDLQSPDMDGHPV